MSPSTRYGMRSPGRRPTSAAPKFDKTETWLGSDAISSGHISRTVFRLMHRLVQYATHDPTFTSALTLYASSEMTFALLISASKNSAYLSPRCAEDSASFSSREWSHAVRIIEGRDTITLSEGHTKVNLRKGNNEAYVDVK
jgi:hypothetical protein